MSVSREEPSISGDLFLVVASWFLRRSDSRVSILIACRRTVPVALSLCVNPMPSRTTLKSTRPRVADRTMVDTVTTTSACQFQKPIGVVATDKDAAVEMEQSKTRNHRARHQARASLLSDKGLDAANHDRASGGGRRMFLTSPLIELAIARIDERSTCAMAILRQPSTRYTDCRA